MRRKSPPAPKVKKIEDPGAFTMVGTEAYNALFDAKMDEAVSQRTNSTSPRLASMPKTMAHAA